MTAAYLFEANPSAEFWCTYQVRRLVNILVLYFIAIKIFNIDILIAYAADHGQLCNSFPDIYKPLLKNKCSLSPSKPDLLVPASKPKCL